MVSTGPCGVVGRVAAVALATGRAAVAAARAEDGDLHDQPAPAAQQASDDEGLAPLRQAGDEAGQATGDELGEEAAEQ